MLTLAVLVWFINQFMWGPVTKAMQARTQRIADGLSAAERGKHELELSQQRAAKDIREAKQQAAEIIANANKQSTEIVEASKEEGRMEGKRQLDAAKAEIDQEKSRAKEQLREEVMVLAIAVAEKVLAREINASVHADFVQDMLKKI